MNDEQLIERLKQVGLEDYVDALMKYKKPCIRLHTSLLKDGTRPILGSSRIGGLPDLPAEIEWLYRNERPCEFIAQINLAELSAYDQTELLPKEGILYFFFDGLDYQDEVYSPNQQGYETIRYYSGKLDKLVQIEDYPNEIQDWQKFRACRVEFEKSVMLPNRGNAVSKILRKDVFAISNPETIKAQEIYWALMEELEPYHERDKHHIFAYPEPVIQDDPFFQVKGVWDGEKLVHDVLSQWVLLLQISSDDNPDGSGMTWGDTGSLYYCIHQDDLLARRFENAICVQQSY